MRGERSRHPGFCPRQDWLGEREDLGLVDAVQDGRAGSGSGGKGCVGGGAKVAAGEGACEGILASVGMGRWRVVIQYDCCVVTSRVEPEEYSSVVEVTRFRKMTVRVATVSFSTGVGGVSGFLRTMIWGVS